MCTLKIGSLLCVDREVLNMEFFFHKQYGIFIPERLPTSNSCCFKANEARTKTNGIFHLFCSKIFLLIVLLPVHGQPVDD